MNVQNKRSFVDELYETKEETPKPREYDLSDIIVSVIKGEIRKKFSSHRLSGHYHEFLESGENSPDRCITDGTWYTVFGEADKKLNNKAYYRFYHFGECFYVVDWSQFKANLEYRLKNEVGVKTCEVNTDIKKHKIILPVRKKQWGKFVSYTKTGRAIWINVTW